MLDPRPRKLYVEFYPEGTRMDEQLIETYEQEFIGFLKSGEEILHLPPMNSYQRRLIHQLASEFKFDTSSEGEGEQRHVVVRKNDDSSAPEKRKTGQPTLWNFGDREFIVNSMESIWIFLAKDGSIGTWDESVTQLILTKKLVTSGSFKIKDSQIIEIQDPNW